MLPHLVQLSAGDWLQFVGVLLAAVVGVSVALAGHKWVRTGQRADALDRALVALFAALGSYASAAEEWAAPAEVPVAGSMGRRFSRGSRLDDVGGPSRVGVVLAVEGVILVARHERERRAVLSLRDALLAMQSMTISEQLVFLERAVEKIRSWRTGRVSHQELEEWAGTATNLR